MKRDHTLNVRPVVTAAVVATVLMLVFGLTYHVLAARLAAPVDTEAISQAALDRFPMDIGGWTGVETPIEERIVQATDTDAHLSRRYSRGNGLDSISFYLATGVRARDLMPHRPEVCYTGAGWTLVDKESAELSLPDEAKLPCNVMRFSRGALNKQGVLVLDYYLVDGQYCADVSLLRSKAWRGSGTVDYVAQVQIVAPVSSVMTTNSAQALVSDFAVESASSVLRLFESRAETRAQRVSTMDSEGGDIDESN
jgi:EpsI family protein